MTHTSRAALLAALVFALAPLACADDEPSINEPDYDRINEDPEAWVDRDVALSGIVTERLTFSDDFPLAFFMGDYPMLGQTLLVVVRSPDDLEEFTTVDVFAGTRVEAAGTLFTYDEGGLADEFGRDLADAAAPFIEDEPGPVLVADVVRPDERLTGGPRISADELAARPQEYLDETVAVEGRVTEQVGAAGYVLDDTVFIARRERVLPAGTEGDEILAVGVVRTPETVEDLTRLIGPPGALAPYEGDIEALVGLPVVVAGDLWSPGSPPGTLE